MATEAENRHFCSNLVTVMLAGGEGNGHTLDGNLEEISSSGACLNVEEPIATGIGLRVVCGDREFPGRVVECRHDAVTGYHVSVSFDDGVEWSPEIYRPAHMVRAEALLAGEAHGEACCDRGVCPKEVIARLLEPEFPLRDRVRAVAREVTTLCGDLTEGDAAQCFGSLFGAGTECQLYAEFRTACAEGMSERAPQHKDLRSQVEALVRLAGAVPAEAVESDSCGASAPWLTPIVRDSE